MFTTQFQNAIRASCSILVAMGLCAIVLYFGGIWAENAHASTYTWAAPVDGAWHEPTRWAPLGVPGPADTAYITNAGQFQVTVRSEALCGTLRLGQDGVAGLWTLWTQSGSLQVSESLTVSTNATWIQSTGVSGNGDFFIFGELQWTAGSMEGAGIIRIEPTGRMKIASNADHFLIQRSLDNFGRVDWSPELSLPLWISGGAEIRNRGGAAMDLGHSGADYFALDGASHLLNEGSLKAKGGALVGIGLWNRGQFEWAGRVSVVGGTNVGSLSVSQCCGAVLEVAEDAATLAPFSFESGTVFSSQATNGEPRIHVRGEAVWSASAPHPGGLDVGNFQEFLGSGTASLIFNSSYTNTSSGNVSDLSSIPSGVGIQIYSGTATVRPGVVVETPQLVILNAPLAPRLGLSNQGSVHALSFALEDRDLENSGSMVVDLQSLWMGGEISGAGQWTLGKQCAARFAPGSRSMSVHAQEIHSFGSNDVSGLVSWQGQALFEVGEGSVLQLHDAEWKGSEATLINEGTLAGTGSIEFLVANYNLMNPSAAGSLSFGNCVQYDGETRLDGGFVVVDPASRFEIRGGILSGTNRVVGNVRNLAFLSPGSPVGRLNIQGDFSNEAEGTVFVTVGGALPIRNYSVLDVDQSVNLNGTLQVVLVNRYYPNPDTEFTVLTGQRLKGRFQQIQCNEAVFTATYFPTSVVLRLETPRLELTSRGLTTDGVFWFQLQADPSQSYQVESSTNLVDWQLLGSMQYRDGFWEFFDSLPNIMPGRFFRSFQSLPASR